MLHLINRAVHTNRRLGARERLVERRFLDVASEAVDRLEPCGGVDGQQVRAQTHVRPVLEVRVVEGEVPAALVGIPGEVDVGYCCEAGTGVFGERVECQAVEDHGEDLGALDGFGGCVE